MKIIIGCDHGGVELKYRLVTKILKRGDKVEDIGCYDENSVDYPEYAHQVASRVASKEFDRGILICGTGIGMCMAANKHKGIRAALCTDTFSAEMTRAHNDANVLCLGGRITGSELAIRILETFLTREFDGDRHTNRINKIDL